MRSCAYDLDVNSFNMDKGLVITKEVKKGDYTRRGCLAGRVGEWGKLNRKGVGRDLYTGLRFVNARDLDFATASCMAKL